MSKYPLHDAAEKGDLERVKKLVEHGAPVERGRGWWSVDCCDDYGQTPLHKVNYWDSKCKVAEYLLGKNCDINARDRKGQTPVMNAAIWGRKEFVLFLIQRGAQVNCLDKDNKSLLHFASSNGWSDVVQLILDTGEADVNSASLSGFTPLMRAADRGHENVISMLIQAGADVNHRENWEQRTALHLAAHENHVKATQVLLQTEGLDINSRDSNGFTPLHDACTYGAEVAKLLLNAGAVTNIKNYRGFYAFNIALRNFVNSPSWTLEVVRLFIIKGAFFDDDDNFFSNSYFSSESAIIRENILNDVELCTKLIANKYNYQSLQTVYSNPYFSENLPPMKNLKLQDKHEDVIKAFVKSEIETNTFCNVKQARPIVLHMMCVDSLLNYMSSMKRSASQASIRNAVASKRTQLN